MGHQPVPWCRLKGSHVTVATCDPLHSVSHTGRPILVMVYCPTRGLGSILSKKASLRKNVFLSRAPSCTLRAFLLAHGFRARGIEWRGVNNHSCQYLDHATL